MNWVLTKKGMPEERGTYLIYLKSNNPLRRYMYITTWFNGVFREIGNKMTHIKTLVQDEWQILAWCKVDFKAEDVHSMNVRPFIYPRHFDDVIIEIKNQKTNAVIYYTGYYSPLGWRISTLNNDSVLKYMTKEWWLNSFVMIQPPEGA